MPSKQRSSPLIPIAAVLSILLALGAGYYILVSGEGRGGSESVAVRSPLGERPEPTPTPAPTPSPDEEEGEEADGESEEEAEPEEAPADATPEPTAGPTATPQPTETPDAEPTPSPTPARTLLTGEVLTHDGQPVPRAQLYLIAKTEDRLPVAVQNAFTREDAHSIVTAGPDGAFEFRLPPGRAYIAGLMLDGEPQSIAREIVPGEAGETINLTMSLPRPFEVRGLVTDERLQRLADMPVHASWRPSTLRGRPAEWREQTLRTGADGRFELEVHEPAEIRLHLRDDQLPAPFLYGRAPLELTRRDFETSRVTRVDLQVVRGVNFTGTVLTGEGAAVGGAEVVMTELLSPRETRSPREMKTTADEEGRFRFQRVFPAEYQIAASHPEYNTGHLRDFRPQAGSQPEIVLHPFAEVHGTAVLAEGTSAGEGLSATAVVVDRYRGWREDFEIGSGGSGEFRIGSLRPGTYRLLVTADGPDGERYFAGRSVRIAAGSNPDVGALVLGRLLEAEGRFVAPVTFGSGYRDLILTARELGEDDSPFAVPADFSPWRRAPLGVISETGRFTIENIREGREYIVRAEDRQSGEILGSARMTGGSGEPVEIGLYGTGRLHGRLLNDRGEACADTLVEVITGIGRVEGPAAPRQRWQTTTDFQGQYSFDDLPAGQARLILQGDETGGRLINIPRGGGLTVDLACRTFVDVALDVIVPEEEPISPEEQFLVIYRSGGDVLHPVQEIYGRALEVRLEPGRYTLTRTATMDSRHFEIAPRTPGRVRVDFTAPANN